MSPLTPPSTSQPGAIGPVSRSETTTSASTSSYNEKDLEAGRRAPSVSSESTDTSDDDSDYNEAIIRVTTADDPSRNDNLLHALRTLTKSATRKTTRTQDDIDATLGTEFEVRWEKDDPEYPMNWSLVKKGWIMFMVSLQTLIVVFYSTSYISGSSGMMKDFGIKNQTVVILGMTTYLFGLACGPLVLAPLSELYGRRPVYIASLVLYTVFVIPSCVAKNFETILICRFLCAFMGSVTISNAPGSLGDIFPEEWRTLAFSVFCIAPMNGPVIGPIVGGFVFQALGWRWLNWIVLISSTVLTAAGLTVPETYAPILLRQRAEKKRKQTGDERYMSRWCYKAGEGDILKLLKVNLSRPLIMLFTEPICTFWAIYIAAIYGILYLSFTAYPIVFAELRGWGPGISGLSFVGMGIGTLFAICLEPLSRKIYNHHAVDPETGKRPPEARLTVVIFASILVPVSLFIFAWTCYPTSIHWVVPILASVPYAIGNVLIFLHSNAYLVTSYDIYSASAMAGNAVTRSILGGVMPLFGPIMYHNMGPNRAATTLACVAVMLAPIPFVFYKWGKKIRMKSPMLVQLQKEKAERGEE
ncbi:MFS general substrate transporter [Ascodesmis nigricans]|uniref:MFS general substrate transporter n=1 Tax=Ascodesmis nigricans TaxID=341454 RepID=A0A4S2MMJ8_9PEZI|nr:MFS general substrate transporter [Ascodesmis nigricans]